MAKPQWSPAQIDRVIAMRKAGTSWRKIQKDTGIPQSTCRRICKVHSDYVPQQPEPEPEIKESIAPPPPAPAEQPAAQAPSQSPDDPIHFRHAKLAELEQDIMQTRQRGQMQVLPTLHRLHINLHDEIRQMRAEAEDSNDMSPDELLNSIVAAVHSLPPLLRHQLDQQLEAHNIVQFKKAEESTG